MTAALIALAAVVGGLWRRWFGGVGGAWFMAVSGGRTSGKTIARFAVLVFTIPAWVGWPWWQAALLGVLLITYFSLPDIDFSDPLTALWRYSLPLAAFCGAAGLYWALPASLVPAASVAVLRQRSGLQWWIFDGWEAWREFFLGASALGIVVAGSLLTPGW